MHTQIHALESYKYFSIEKLPPPTNECLARTAWRVFLSKEAVKQSPNKEQIMRNLNYTQKNILCASHPCDSEVIRNGCKRSLCLCLLMFCTYSSGSDVAALTKHGEFYWLLTYAIYDILNRLQSANVHVTTAALSGSLETLCHSRSNFCLQFFTVPGRITNP